MALPDLSKPNMVAVDTETTGKHWWRDKLFGISLYAPEIGSFYADVRSDEMLTRWMVDQLPRVKRWCAHNVKFDAHMLREFGILMPHEDRMYCTMVRAALIDEHRLGYDLDSLGEHYLKERKTEDIYEKLADLFGGSPTRSAQIGNLHRAPKALVGEYAEKDAELAYKLWHWQESEIERQNLHKVERLERLLTPVLIDMEVQGVAVDVDKAEETGQMLDREIEKTQSALDKASGRNGFNANSPKQVKELFDPKPSDTGQGFVLRDGTWCPQTNANNPSLQKETLQAMKDPAAARILEYRSLVKMRGTFIDGHILGSHDDGVVHCSFNQTKNDSDLGTGTGRLSVSDPALQQIPGRDKSVASVIRALFLPDPGQKWACYDWRQFEFRQFAHYSQDAQILRVYREDAEADYHGLVGEITGLPRKHTPGVKGNAKQINLGLVFGMGAGKLADEMGLPYEWSSFRKRGQDFWYKKAGQETKEILANYHRQIPGVKKFLEGAESVAKSRGYVITAMGRHLRFPRGHGAHKAGGLILQGSSADAMKVKMIEAYEFLKDRDARLMLSVHDELGVSADPDDYLTLEGVKDILESFGQGDQINLRVPIRSDFGMGSNWYAASKEE